MINKKKKINYIVLIFIFTMMGFRYYQSLNRDYKFIYPSWWHKQLIENGDYYNGLVFSLNSIEDSEISHNNGGFIMITTHQTENDAETISDYIQKLQNSEDLRVKSGILPIIPGPSQYKLIVPNKAPPKGFEEVSSLYSFGSYTEAHEYWRIKNNKLYILTLKYPADEKQRGKFELGTKLIFLTFNIF